jgi:glutamate/aspartate transport system substrate-binding protein
MKRPLAALLLAALACAISAQAQTLERIKKAGAINVAYSPDSLPWSFGDAADPKGYSIDLCKRVIAQIGRAVGEPNIKVNWIAASTPQRLIMIEGGRADLDCANTTQTLGRMARVDFSSLIFIESGGFITRADSPIRGLSDAGGKKIAVLKSTTTETRLRDALKKRLVNANVILIDDAVKGIEMMEMGSVDLYAGDKVKLVGLVATSKDPAKFAMLTDDISFEPYAFALPRNDSALRTEVNRALTQVYTSGEIEGIFNQWLGRLGKPTNLLAAMFMLYAIPE